jgi:hypothetical protein
LLPHATQILKWRNAYYFFDLNRSFCSPDNGRLLFLQWAQAIDSLEVGQPGSGKSFGIQQRPHGDVEIDEKFWEQDFEIPSCHQCGGVLKCNTLILGV